MSVASSTSSPRAGSRRVGLPRPTLLPLLSVGFVMMLLVGVGVGPMVIPPHVSVAILLSKLGITLDIPFTTQQDTVLWVIRLPRVVLGALVGAGLAVSGALLQGVFRNPLADPGLIGVSSGAALGAVTVIVFGGAVFGLFTLSIVAFIGGAITTLCIYRLANRGGRTDVASMLLIGLALNALVGAATGVLIYLADDPQLRSIVFWTMGGLGGALWTTVLAIVPFIVVVLVIAPILGRALNLFALGEAEARHLGVEIEAIKRWVILLAALATGAAVAVAGPIGFVGLIVPHIIRLIAGPDHRLLLPACALGGATLLISADMLARTIAAPAEIPVGLITAFAGGPFFLVLILRTRKMYGW